MGFQDADETAYVGVPGTFYKAWHDDDLHDSGEYRLPRDSGRKLVEALDDTATQRLTWQYGHTDHTQTHDDYRPIDAEHPGMDHFKGSHPVRERIMEHLDSHDSYYVDVLPEDSQIKIWSIAISRWEIESDNLQYRG